MSHITSNSKSKTKSVKMPMSPGKMPPGYHMMPDGTPMKGAQMYTKGAPKKSKR